MPSNNSGEAKRVVRRQQVWNLRIQGKTEQDIAAAVEVSQSTVNRDLKRLIQKATRNLDEEVKQERIVQLHQLHLVVKEAFEAWAESKKPGQQIIETNGVVSRTNPEGKGTTTKIGTKQTGNPAYLTLAMKAMEDIRKLFGLDAFKDDWESELKAAGLNPAEIFETMVQSAYQAMTDKGETNNDRINNMDKLDP